MSYEFGTLTKSELYYFIISTERSMPIMKLIIVVVIFVGGLQLNAQVQEEWVARYNGPLNASDCASSIVVDESGNVYVTGPSDGIGTGSDYATIKYNSSGVQQWIVRYNGPGNAVDNASSIAIDASGNVFVTGVSRGSGTGDDYATIKYNSSGVQQWIVRYNGPENGDDYAYSIAVDGSGNVYVTGYSFGGETFNDYATIKYNSSGVQQWVARYNGPGNGDDRASTIAVDGSGSVYVTGISTGSGGTSFDIATVKYNSQGIQQWVVRYSAGSDDWANAIALDATGNVYVTGGSVGSGTGVDYVTIKYNSTGAQQWVARYNGLGNSTDQALSIAVDLEGNVYVTGESNGIVTNVDYATIKYNSSGVQQWVARYNGPGNDGDRASSIALDATGNVYVTGWSAGIGTGISDYATIKYNSPGVEQWVARHDGPGSGSDLAYSIAVDGSGNVYVTGSSYGGSTSTDYATIKYTQTPGGVYQTDSDVPNEYFLSQNYPNPFNATTSIEFSLPTLQYVSLKVFNVLGQEKVTLVEEQLNAGSYITSWDATGFSSGIYYYRLQTSDHSQTNKLILLK